MSKLNESEIQDIINEVLCGKKIFSFNEETLYFVQPKSEQKMFASFLEQEAVKKAKKEGIPSEKELSDDFIEKFFSDLEKKELEELTKKVTAYENIILPKLVKETPNYQEKESIYNELRRKQNLLKLKQKAYIQYTAEYKGQEEKNYYFLQQCTYKLSGELKWRSLDELYNYYNPSQASELLYKFLEFFWGPNLSTIRQVARHQYWRTLYVCANKSALNLINLPVVDFSFPQTQLLIWSLHYDRVYDMMLSDRPDDEVIEDDKRLDAFLENYYLKMKKEAQKVSSNLGGKKTKDPQEKIITASSPEYIRLHRQKAYSDPKELLKNREGSEYNEASERKKKALARKGNKPDAPKWR